MYCTAPSSVAHSYVSEKVRGLSPATPQSASSIYTSAPSPAQSAWSAHVSLGSHEPRTPWAPNVGTIELPRTEHRGTARGPAPSYPLQLNPLLSYDASKQLLFKLKYPLNPREVANPAWLQHPATHPPTSSLTITIPHAPRTWTWTINASAPGHAVTAGEVLHYLYKLFQASMSEAEFQTVHPMIAEEMNQAFQRRTKGNTAEYQRGLRRVDFLGRNNRFLGLAPSKDRSGSWMLCTGPPPPS